MYYRKYKQATEFLMNNLRLSNRLNASGTNIKCVRYITCENIPVTYIESRRVFICSCYFGLIAVYIRSFVSSFVSLRV